MRARHRRRIHLIFVLAWSGPGLLASYFWAHSLAWIVFMSWFANVYSCVSAFSAETPVEEE